jgi:hypothetical protein
MSKLFAAALLGSKNNLQAEGEGELKYHLLMVSMHIGYVD